MTPRLYAAIAPLLTVYSRERAVSAAVASRAVLLAVSGLDAEQVDAYLAAREAAKAEGVPAPPPPAGANLSATGGKTYSIRAVSRDPSGVRAVVEGVVHRGGGGGEELPFTILSWHQS
jgi:methylmalonyl-CoA mutase cobalamin-binding subunit